MADDPAAAAATALSGLPGLGEGPLAGVDWQVTGGCAGHELSGIAAAISAKAMLPGHGRGSSARSCAAR